MINWLEKWYAKRCNGEWEHGFGIKIETIDNPGWSIEISLKNTEWEDIDIPWCLHETSAKDWYGVRVVDGIFFGAGDYDKLNLILEVFQKIVEKKYKEP